MFVFVDSDIIKWLQSFRLLPVVRPEKVGIYQKPYQICSYLLDLQFDLANHYLGQLEEVQE